MEWPVRARSKPAGMVREQSPAWASSLTLAFSFAISGRLKVGKFEHVRDGNGAPIGRDAVPLFISDVLRGDDRAAIADNDHPGIKDVIGRAIDQPNSKWLERLIIKFTDYIVMGHRTVL
jgi:hypothetical protein